MTAPSIWNGRVLFIKSTALGGTESQGYLLGKTVGGTVLNGGEIAAGGPITNAPDGFILGAGREANPGVPDPEVFTSTNTRTRRICGTGNGDWGVVRAGEYVFLGGNITDKLANYLAYRGLAGGGSDTGGRKSIHKRNKSHMFRLTTYAWDFAYAGLILGTGKTYPTLTKAYTASTEAGGEEGAGAGAVGYTADVAANASRAIPGHLCFTVNGKVAIVTNYLPKTN